MSITEKNRMKRGGILMLLFVVYTILVKTIDVAPVGPMSTKVGFSHINMAVWNALGVHHFWYELTEFFGILALLVCVYFACVGALQLVRRRSLFAVDRNILVTGGLYIVVLALYALFEKVVVNCRPVIMPGASAPEASFPSSHTMLICVVMVSAILLMKDYVFRKTYPRQVAQLVCGVIIVVTILGRLICGVHWLTDILGGVLLSAALLEIYVSLLEKK